MTRVMCTNGCLLKPGSHPWDEHNTSEISISASTRKRNMFLFLVLMLVFTSPVSYLTSGNLLTSLVLCLSHKCEPGLTGFVSTHTFCASRKAWFKCHVCAGLTLTQSTMLPSTQLKWKQNFPTVTKSSYLNQEHQNSSISLTTNC